MKKTWLATLIILSAITAFGQDTEEEETPRNQLGINATLFIKQFLTLSNTTQPLNNPFLITYKHNLANNVWLRAGVGATYDESKNNPNDGSPMSTSNNMTTNLRAGVEWQHGITKRWLFYNGVDAGYNYNLSRIKTSTVGGFPPVPVEISTETEEFGFFGGPVLGIEFKINDKISFNAETTLYYTYSESRRRETNPLFGQFNENRFTASSNFRIIVPTSLFFVFSF
ncbi:MAG TPA: outer membrane beta-barrel protein [Bacteroidia bacterium]|nr:outer membrane beta-barrel protein [Bacteroidia bacterium]